MSTSNQHTTPKTSNLATRGLTKLTAQNVLITGGYGCIGSETTKWLLKESDARVIVASRDVSIDRGASVFGKVDERRLAFVSLDVRDPAQLLSVLQEQNITHVAHMAGLQTPDCNEHRDLGLQVNLAGTQNLIEAIKHSDQSLQRFIFASSIAVYGPRAEYPAGRVPMDARPQPVNVYGAWKLAGEHVSRLFHVDTGVPTISVRPGALFGPGRDIGLTATPTTAMKHVALGRSYQIPYRNRQDYLYAPDVGAAIGNSLLEPFSGYAAFTLPGNSADTSTLVASMRRTASVLGIEDQFNITVGEDDVPFMCDIDFTPFIEAFPKSPLSSIDQAVQQSIEYYCAAAAAGNLSL